MRRKIKTLAARVPLRKAATTASPASRRPFPAWIDADERTVTFPAAVATPRVRDGLILRAVAKKKSATGKSSTHAHGAK